MTDERDCPHTTTEPVVTGGAFVNARVVVARICTTCFTQLPIAWGCDACEWIEARELCSYVPIKLLATPCEAHRQTWTAPTAPPFTPDLDLIEETHRR